MFVMCGKSVNIQPIVDAWPEKWTIQDLARYGETTKLDPSRLSKM